MCPLLVVTVDSLEATPLNASKQQAQSPRRSPPLRRPHLGRRDLVAVAVGPAHLVRLDPARLVAHDLVDDAAVPAGVDLDFSRKLSTACSHPFLLG